MLTDPDASDGGTLPEVQGDLALGRLKSLSSLEQMMEIDQAMRYLHHAKLLRILRCTHCHGSLIGIGWCCSGLRRQYHHRHNFYSRSVSSDAQKVAHIGLTNAEVRLPSVVTSHIARQWITLLLTVHVIDELAACTLSRRADQVLLTPLSGVLLPPLLLPPPPQRIAFADLSPYINLAPLTVRDCCPLGRVFTHFRTMGLRHAVVVDRHNAVPTPAQINVNVSIMLCNFQNQ